MILCGQVLRTIFFKQNVKCNFYIFTTEEMNMSSEELLARFPVQSQILLEDDVRVLDPITMHEVPPDGTTIGEVMIKGSVVMKGYLKNAAATEEAFQHGWYHSGDLAVNHGRGRFEIRDRSKGTREK